MVPSADDLTTEEVAARLKVEVDTVRGWLKAGRLHGYKVGPRLWRVPVLSLAELCQEPHATTERPSVRRHRLAQRAAEVEARRLGILT